MACGGDRMNSNTAYVTASTAPSAQPRTPSDFKANGSPHSGEQGHPASEAYPRLRDLGPAAALLFAGMAALLIATLAPSGKDGQYAVIAPPWYRLGDTIALIQKAGGGIVDMGGPAYMVIAHSENPDFVRTLYGAGALLVIDPLRLRGCIGFRPEAQ